MNRISQTQGNTPPGGKPIDKSYEYWERRHQEERKANRGAPEDPYRPNYNRAVSLNKRNDQVSEELLRTYKILKRLELNLETKNNLKIKNITELPKTSNLFKKKFSLDITSNNQDFTFVLYQLNPTPDEDSPLGISANEKDAAMIILTDTFNNLKTLLQERLRRRLENSSGNHPTEL